MMAPMPGLAFGGFGGDGMGYDDEDGDEYGDEDGDEEDEAAMLAAQDPAAVAALMGITGQGEEAVRMALAAAYGNQDAAVDYLFNG